MQTTKMSNSEKLKLAKKLLSEVSASWEERMIEEHGYGLRESFDEYIAGLNTVRLRDEFETALGRFIAFPEFGCYWGIVVDVMIDSTNDLVLFFCPMNADGTPDKENIGEVELLGEDQMKVAKEFFGKFDWDRISVEA